MNAKRLQNYNKIVTISTRLTTWFSSIFRYSLIKRFLITEGSKYKKGGENTSIKNKRYDVFISYKNKGGTGWAELLHRILQNQEIEKDRIFFYREKSSNNLAEEVLHSLNMIVIFSYRYINNLKKKGDDCELEIKKALESKINIIPFYEDKTIFEELTKKNKVLPDFIKRMNLSDKYQSVIYRDEGWENKIVEYMVKDEIQVTISSSEDMSVKIFNHILGNKILELKANNTITIKYRFHHSQPLIVIGTTKGNIMHTYLIGRESILENNKSDNYTWIEKLSEKEDINIVFNWNQINAERESNIIRDCDYSNNIILGLDPLITSKMQKDIIE